MARIRNDSQPRKSALYVRGILCRSRRARRLKDPSVGAGIGPGGTHPIVTSILAVAAITLSLISSSLSVAAHLKTPPAKAEKVKPTPLSEFSLRCPLKFITGICTDGPHLIWVAGEDNGLYAGKIRYRGPMPMAADHSASDPPSDIISRRELRVKWYHFDKNNFPGLASNFITAIGVDGKGRLWAGIDIVGANGSCQLSLGAEDASNGIVSIGCQGVVYYDTGALEINGASSGDGSFPLSPGVPLDQTAYYADPADGGAGGTIVTAQVSGNGGGGGASEAPIDAESLYKQVLIHLGPFIAPEISFSHVAGKCSAPVKTKIGWRENPGQAYTHPMIDAVVTTHVGGTVLQAQIFGQPFADIWTDSPSCSIECQTPNFWTTTSPQTGQDQVGIETGLTAGGVIKFDNGGGKSSKNLVTAGNNGKEDQEDNATNSPAITSMSLPPGHWDLSQYPLGADMVVGTLLPGNPLFTPVQDPSFSTPLPPHKLEAVFTWR